MPRAIDKYPQRRGGDDTHSPLRGLQDFTSPIDLTAQVAGDSIRDKIEDVIAFIESVTGLDLSIFAQALEGIDIADPGAILKAIAGTVREYVIDPFINAITGSNWSGQDPASLQMILDPWVKGLAATTQIAHGAWDFSAQALAAISQIAQQAVTAPLMPWLQLLDSVKFWTLSWFTNTYNTQQQTSANSGNIGLLFAHLNPGTSSIAYTPIAGRALTANYVGPDGMDSGKPAFTPLAGVKMLVAKDGYVGGDTDFDTRAAWFTGNPMNNALDRGLISDKFHVEVKIMRRGFGIAGFFCCGIVSGNTLGAFVMLEIQMQDYGDSLLISTFTGVQKGRNQRYALATNNGMTRFQVGDVVAMEYDNAGRFATFINGRPVYPDGGVDYWYDAANVVAHGPGKREIGIIEANNGPRLGEFRAYDVPTTTAATPIVVPPATVDAFSPIARTDGKLSPDAPTIDAYAPTPAVAGVSIIPPVVGGNGTVAMGFHELQQQLAKTADAKALIARMYTEVASLRPKYWRMMAAWNYIAKSRDPGTPTFDTVNNVPTTSNRDWTTLDAPINDVLLLGVEVNLIVGQDRPGTPGLLGRNTPYSWVNAAAYGDFAAEVADRYKPGGVGIRTDGKYAANAGRGVRIFECWNEQNSTAFWVLPTNAKQYTEYLKAMYTSIKEVPGLGGTSSLVLFGGMQHITRNAYQANWTWAGIPEIDFLKGCWNYEPNLANYFDVMTEHIYPQSDTVAFPSGGATSTGPAPLMTIDNMQQLKAIHELLVAKGVPDKPIWITEAGYSNSSMSEAQSAAYVKQLYELLASLGYVQVVMWHNIFNAGKDPKNIEYNWGFARRDLTHKPVWDWMASYANVTPAPAAATFEAVAPVIVNPIVVPPATVTAVAPAPLSVTTPVAVPVAVAVATSRTPIIVNPEIVPVALGSAAARAPIVVTIVSVPAALVALAAREPAVVNPIMVPAATGTAAARPPVNIAATLTAPAATGTWSALPPKLDARIPIPSATGTATAPTPVVVGYVPAPAATATAASVAPVVVNGITVPAATGTAAGVAPMVVNRVPVPAATAAAAAPSPTMAPVPVVVPPATGTADMAGVIVIDVITVGAAMALGVALVPSVSKNRALWIGVAPSTGSGTVYNTITPSRQYAWDTSAPNTRIPLSDACVVTKLTVWSTAAPGTGNSWTYKLQANGLDTGCTLVMSGSATTATWTGNVPLAQLDMVGMCRVSAGSPPASGVVYWVIEYQTDSYFFMVPSANKGYVQVSNGNVYNPPSGGLNATPSTAATAFEQIAPMSCAVAKIAAAVENSPSADDTNTYRVRVNNTTDSAFSAAISGTNKVAISSDTGTPIALAPGDTFVIRETKGPASAWSPVRTCISVVPSNPGEMFLTFGSTAAPSTTATVFETPFGNGNEGWNATEASVSLRITAATIRSLFAKIVTAPGSGKSRSFRARLNAADSGVGAVIADAATTANDTAGSAVAADGDLLAFATTPTGTPAGTAGSKVGVVLVPA